MNIVPPTSPSVNPPHTLGCAGPIDPRDAQARAGAGSAAYLTPDGDQIESLADYLARTATPTLCRSCGVELVSAPNHPGAHLGEWYVHPAAGDGFGHTSAAMTPRGAR